MLDNPITLNEKTLNTEDRKKLRDEDFGLPESRRYPLVDAEHVRSALRYFYAGHMTNAERTILARNILKAARKFGVDVDLKHDVHSWK